MWKDVLFERKLGLIGQNCAVNSGKTISLVKIVCTSDNSETSEDSEIKWKQVTTVKSKRYDMLFAQAYQNPYYYDGFESKRATHDDVQILFRSFGYGVIGHWITIHYTAKSCTVVVYDSNNRERENYLCNNHREIIEIRYGAGTEIIFADPNPEQPDGTSCGVFAIAYATAILLGVRPTDFRLRLRPKSVFVTDRAMELRMHLRDMFITGRFRLFPFEDMCNGKFSYEKTKRPPVDSFGVISILPFLSYVEQTPTKHNFQCRC